QKLYEVQKHISILNHAHLNYVVITNKKFWDGLPADIRAQLDKAMAEATDYTNSIAAKENEDALGAIRAAGKSELYEPTAAEKEEWRKALTTVYKSAESRIGAETIKELQAAAQSHT